MPAPIVKAQEQEISAPPANLLQESDAPQEIDDSELDAAFDELESQLDDLQAVIDEAANEQDVNSLPEIDPENEPDVFYDSTPVGRRGVQPSTPEKVDPINKPAGKFIIVTKDFEADEDQAILIAAQRALKLGRNDSALGFYDQLRAKNPRDPRVLMGRAIALQKLGRMQSALQAYEELLDVQPDNLEAEISMMGLMKERFPAVALKRLLELYREDPNNAGLNAQIGMAYAQIGNVGDAMRYLGSAVSLEPNNPQYFYNLAVLNDRGGRFKEAVKFYEEALAKDTLYGNGTLPRDVIYERLDIIRKRS